MKGYVGILLLIIFTVFLACVVFAGDNIKTKDETTLQPKARTGQFMPMGAGLGMMHGRMGIIPNVLGMENELKLSEDQKAKIQELILSHRKDMISKKAEREMAEVELFELMQKDNPDMNMIKEKMQKIANINVDQQLSAFKLSMDIKNVLTDEQWKKFEEQVKGKRPMMGYMGRRAGSRRFGQPGRNMR